MDYIWGIRIPFLFAFFRLLEVVSYGNHLHRAGVVSGAPPRFMQLEKSGTHFALAYGCFLYFLFVFWCPCKLH